MSNGEGLLHAYLLDGKGRGHRLEMADMESWTPERGVLWVHLDYTSEDTRHWLRNSAGLEEGSSSLRFDLATLRRQTITLRRYLAPQRDAFAKLVTEKIAWLDDDCRLRLREVSDRLIRNIEELDAVRERAAVTQEELLSRLSDQMNSRMYVMSLVAAIFLPLGFLTGLLGINVGGIPGAENSWAFLIFMLFIAGIVVAQMLWFRRKKWF